MYLLCWGEAQEKSFQDLKAALSSSSCILFQAAWPIKTRQAKRQIQTKEAYKYTDKMR